MKNDTSAMPDLNKSEHILLTGATGVLGAQVLKQLLMEDKSFVHCLVRAGTLSEGRDRLLGLLKAYDADGRCLDAFARRVIPIVGDISIPQFGLSDDDYQALVEKIDNAFHVAAYTNLFARMHIIENINVAGTKNMIAFALATKQKRLNFVSTFTVMGDKAFDPSFVFKEEHFDVGQGFEDMTYQKTKFMCEGLVREATQEGLVWNIFRPGQIFGQSDNGHYPQGQTNVSGLFYDIFKTIIETRVAFVSAAYFDISPVDYVARSMVHLALRESKAFETYHLTNPDNKSYLEVVQLITEFGYPIELVSQDEYREMLQNKSLRILGSDEPYASITTKAFTWWFSREKFDYRVSAMTDATYTKKILEKVGIVCPKIDAKLIETYLRLGIERDYFPLPPSVVPLTSISAPFRAEKAL